MISTFDISKYDKEIFLEHIFKSLPYYIFWKNRESVYLGCNDNFAKLVNRDAKNIIGLTDYDLNWGEGEADFYRQADQKVMSGTKQVNQEEVLVRPDGTIIIMLVSKVPVIKENGDVIGVLGISTDITQMKKVENELIEAKKTAECAAQVMKIFATSIAHELRTPLASISACTHGIKKYLPSFIESYQLANNAGLLTEKIRNNHFQALFDVSENINAEIHYTNTMINMLLMKTNSTAIKYVELSICSISKCIDLSIARYPFKNMAEKNYIKWKNSDDFLFRGNELLMIHILFNLVKNAIYYIEAAGKGDINIWIESKNDENFLHFKDSGKGISKKVLPQIFDLYFSDTPHGAGIGLAFCKQVMQSFLGDIICKSKEGEYTHFIMKFPYLNDNHSLYLEQTNEI